MAGEFVISLDFELLWGVRDHATRDSYGANVMGARQAVPRMLELFDKYEVSVTWATVGFLFCENREELLSCLPPPEMRPTYDHKALSNYAYLDEVGENETADPYYFASSLIKQIADVPGQEIATHTMSHYYCLEDGQTLQSFEHDLASAIALAAKRDIKTRSIVFPRNQYSQSHLDVCRKLGITSYRGNPKSWAYHAGKGTSQTLARRGLRLADAYSGLLGTKSYEVETGAFQNVPASQFLRPCAGRLKSLYPAHLRSLKSTMTTAAKTSKGYHLWWHPHNFGANLGDNLRGLEVLLEHFQQLKDQHGMVSRPMCPDFA